MMIELFKFGVDSDRKLRYYGREDDYTKNLIIKIEAIYDLLVFYF